MSVTVLAPTPALPPVRRPSMWEKMFGNFKMGKTEEYEIEPSRVSPASPRGAKSRLASVSTGVETAQITYKRNASVAMGKEPMAKESRSCSAPLPQPASPSKTRTGSIASFKSRRSSRSRRNSWWRSANPETDESVPAVPAIDRKYSLFGSHNPDVEVENSPSTSPTASRRPSYVPRNAASSFLRTTTPLSSEEKAEVIRRSSVADMRSASNAPVVNKSPFKAQKPAPLKLNNASNDSTADHGMFSMAGVCEIQEPDMISPRNAVFSVASGPRSPTDTIMEVDIEVIDSAKPSPELAPVKAPAQLTVVELVG